jgi:hypothetical protein
VATYIRWYLADEDMWCYAELDERRWALRHVEQRERDDVFFVAASLAEELYARDEKGLEALNAYHATYGSTPELPIDGFDHRSATVAPDEFERIWQQARRAREAGWGVRPR